MTRTKHLSMEEMVEGRIGASDDSLREQAKENIEAAQLAEYDELVDAEYERLRDVIQESIREWFDSDSDSDSASTD